jgi:hypothetical protein
MLKILMTKSNTEHLYKLHLFIFTSKCLHMWAFCRTNSGASHICEERSSLKSMPTSVKDWSWALLIIIAKQFNRKQKTFKVKWVDRQHHIGWSKSNATHIKVFFEGCNSIQFDWINKHTISLWLYKSPRRSRHVETCSRQSVSCLQTVEVQGCVFHNVQRVFIVEHCLASRSYLTS